MRAEGSTVEYKAIKKIKTGLNGFKSLAVTCVSFANSEGGCIYIGIDDKTKKPPIDQQITQEKVNEAVSRLRSLCYGVAIMSPKILTHENGSQYCEITILPSHQSIASTSEGKIFRRIGDKCFPVHTEDLAQLAEEKDSYQWELMSTRCKISDIPSNNIANFIDDIKKSDRVSEFIKSKDSFEILEHYHLVDDGVVTRIGVLWLGTFKQRSRLVYPITVQYIVYDQFENKVRKVGWHDNTKTPKELLLEIEAEAKELKYSYEFASGLFRKDIPHYNSKVIRELLVNAFVHKSFTISQDITISVYPDRVEISNAGGLPLGVTANNILHKQRRRNPHLLEIMKALGFMEGEGSGYDLVYELNAMEAKHQPRIEVSYGEVRVIQEREIIDKELIPLLDFVMTNYELTQKEYTAFGSIAKKRKILSTELSLILQLEEEDRLRNYTKNLLKEQLIKSEGVKKATCYFVNPVFIKNAKVNLKTTLKTLDSHALQALILEDLRLYPDSKMKDIISRLPSVDIKNLKKEVYSMTGGKITIKGGLRNRTYSSNDGIKKTN